MKEFDELVKIMEKLRKKCPWDKEQTHKSLRQYLIEETYEVINSIEEGNFEDLKEELGDLLLQVLFHAEIARENGRFTIKDVIKTISGKLIRRHPHVFEKVIVETPEEVFKNWEIIKREEGKTSILDGVPQTLPALLKAYRIQEKVAGVGFDWELSDDVFSKIEEEVAELKESIKSENTAEIEEEIGDLIFSIVNISRFYKINTEDALRKTNEKFMNRFKYVEQKITEHNKKLGTVSLEEMDKFWEEAKKTQ